MFSQLDAKNVPRTGATLVPAGLGSSYVALVDELRSREARWCLPLPVHASSAATQRLVREAGLELPTWERPLPSSEGRSAEDVIDAWEVPRFADSGRGHVIAGRDSSLAWPAIVFAAVHGRSIALVDDVTSAIAPAAARAPSSITVWLAPEQITWTLTSALLSKHDSSRIPFGFVTGRNPIEVWSWLFRRSLATELYRDYRGILVVDDDAARDTEMPAKADVFAHDEVDSERFEQFSQRSDDVALMRLHSRESCGRLGTGLLCGRAEHEPDDWSNRVVPGCAGGRPCIWTADPRFSGMLEIGKMRAAHLVIASCASLRLAHAMTDFYYSLGLTAFAGTARSYVSATRMVCSGQQMLALATQLVLMGESIGCLTLHMNEFLEHTRNDLPTFVMLGDPEDRPGLAAPSELPPRFESLVNLDSTAHHPSRARGLSSPSSGDTAVIHGRLRAADTAGVLLESWTTALDGSATRDVLAQLSAEIVGDLGRIDQRDSLWLSNAYPRRHHEIHSYSECESCRQRVIHYRRELFGGEHRFMGICERCGIIFDGPSLELRCRLICPEHVIAGESFDFGVEVENVAATSVIAASLSISQGDSFGWLDLPRIWMASPPLESRVSWRTSLLIPASLPALVHNVRAFVLVDGELWALSQPIISGGRPAGVSMAVDHRDRRELETHRPDAASANRPSAHGETSRARGTARRQR
jgi:hypothetical protein